MTNTTTLPCIEQQPMFIMVRNFSSEGTLEQWSPVEYYAVDILMVRIGGVEVMCATYDAGSGMQYVPMHYLEWDATHNCYQFKRNLPIMSKDPWARS